ncbi:MAG: twin-arginine translocation signal domain-containing protein [Candidatus Scalindua rubra]|uniref:Desulfoferrodoxin n=1 Tax=Candidatus Scalindua brodae TaxID=237368 RepID=A0A0B0EJV4_9BACT|nr:MAG: Desulfoferrodoxin [Candidatus Scalindua brodae]MBZ0109141.1 twin-arginine translocation signal domain-containing protein [Candidatus Scalindua rubra]TWU33578.1 Desulfoferrodoxin [Candidatus Brocadiaceae bacterium S225]
MSNRRTFLKSSLAVAAGFAVGHISPVSANSACSYPKGIIYTKQNPGKWSGKIKGHMPNVTVEGNKVTVTTTHGMSEEHYIVRHTIVSKCGKVLGEKTFHPSDVQAKSIFELKDTSTKYAWDTITLYATSFCNKHDLWVTEFEV